MESFILTFALMALSLLGMAVGVLISKKTLKGSCGGLGALMGDDCDFCDSKDDCPDLKQANSK